MTGRYYGPNVTTMDDGRDRLGRDVWRSIGGAQGGGPSVALEPAPAFRDLQLADPGDAYRPERLVHELNRRLPVLIATGEARPPPDPPRQECKAS